MRHGHALYYPFDEGAGIEPDRWYLVAGTYDTECSRMSTSVRRVLTALALFLVASALAADALEALQVTSSDPFLQPWSATPHGLV